MKNKTNKTVGITFIGGALLYFIFTTWIVGHGIHPLNTIVAIILFFVGFVYGFRGQEVSPEVHPSSSPEEPNSAKAQKLKIYFISFAFLMLSFIILALFYVSTTTSTALTATLSFAGGVSNIFLPCTLPLVFVIVPLSMGQGYKKGLIMALLFGAGLTIMLAIYGAGIAVAGKYLGLDQTTRILYLVAGVAALVFGLSELALITFKMPSMAKTPGFIQRQSDYLKTFFLGLFLGNAGVGCPNPITYLILIAAAGSGSVTTGAFYMGVNGLGRVLPLLFFSVLGIVGVNATGALVRRKKLVDSITGWALVLIASFIILNGAFGHLWYEGSFVHTGLNRFFANIGGERIAEAKIPIEEVEAKVPFIQYAGWMNLLFPIFILVWYFLRKKREEMSLRTFVIILIIFIIWGLALFDFGGGGM